MVTRDKHNIVMAVDKLNLLATNNSISLVPKTYHSALSDLNWHHAMSEEYKALHPHGANVVTGKWIFKYKFHSDGSLARHKARWAVHGYSQQPGVDFDKTFNSVVKPSTIHVFLSLVVSRSWPIH